MLHSEIAKAAHRVEAGLHARVSKWEKGDLQNAVLWALQGGKCLRGFLAMESARLFHVSPQMALYPAMAIEAMHAYSLVHDDLPAMDDDDLRRGRATIHKKWDEATAILTGDALHSFAFSVLSEPDYADPAIQISLVSRLAQAAGGRGMVLGQLQDMQAGNIQSSYNMDDISTMQALKTGALFVWSGTAGAILAKAPIASLQTYSEALGRVFQIGDDLLDIRGNVAITGKRVNKDVQAGKTTFVTLLGEDGARQLGRELIDIAKDAVSPFGDDADLLRTLVQHALERSR